MTPEEMQRRKIEMGLTYEQLSELCGVPTATIQKIVTGTTKGPYSYNRKAVETVLNPDYRPDFMRVSERPYVYHVNKDGEYTSDDYYNLPDDQKYELIDGKLYVMEGPSFNHQTIVAYVYHQLWDHVKVNGGKCLVRMLPQDIKVARDERTIVQPDLFILCDRNRITPQWIWGPPDFVMEVLSKSTRKKDVTVKFAKYLESGVREYWVIDPQQEKIITYDFTQEPFGVSIYGFDSKVPVSIWNGACVVDFSGLKDELIDFGPEEDAALESGPQEEDVALEPGPQEEEQAPAPENP